jgi:fructoselysine-6-P-deglycase FrlB-like protein
VEEDVRVSSLDAMKKSIENQPGDLLRYCEQLQGQRSEYAPLDPTKTIFTGSGDSFSAALFASELSKGISQVFDPYELFKKPWLAQGKNIIIISVSGKTKTNIELAKKLRPRARAVVAVTSDPLSPLSLQCHGTLVLSFQRDSAPTAGTSSYTSSLLACGFLLGKFPKEVKANKMLARAWKWAEKWVGQPVAKSLIFVGSGVDHAIGYYGALKFNEILGFQANCQYPEEFGHAYLFSVKKADPVVCLNNDRKTQAVFQALRRSDFRALSIRSQSEEPLLRSIELAFHFQCFSYLLARRKGLKECAYISDKKRLAISSRLIY